MSELSTNAKNLASRYIRKASPDIKIKPKRRGLQAEVNKLEAIRRAIINTPIDVSELIRFRTELNKVQFAVDEAIRTAE